MSPHRQRRGNTHVSTCTECRAMVVHQAVRGRLSRLAAEPAARVWHAAAAAAGSCSQNASTYHQQADKHLHSSYILISRVALEYWHTRARSHPQINEEQNKRFAHVHLYRSIVHYAMVTRPRNTTDNRPDLPQSTVNINTKRVTANSWRPISGQLACYIGAWLIKDAQKTY